MSRIIESATIGNFPPMVGLRSEGDFVKGTVTVIGQTKAGNPVISLSLIDMEGKTSISKSKGVYEEVSVNVGDLVQVIGSVKQLKDKLPQLIVGDVVTITYLGKRKIPGNKTRNEFEVKVD